MSELDGKGITQLLLSPLYLLNHIFGVLIPGALLLLLLALKGNVLLHQNWASPLFGYKTKVAVFLVLAYIVGSMLKLPLYLVAMVLRPFRQKAEIPAFKHLDPDVQQALTAVVTDGVLLANPVLLDRLSLAKSNAAFHVGTGMALLVASSLPGDGSSLRWLEFVLGTAMFVAGWRLVKELIEMMAGAIGIGLANILAGINPQQLEILKAAMSSLGLGVAKPAPQPVQAVEAALTKSE